MAQSVVVNFLTDSLGPYKVEVYGPFESLEAAQAAIDGHKVLFSRATVEQKAYEISEHGVWE